MKGANGSATTRLLLKDSVERWQELDMNFMIVGSTVQRVYERYVVNNAVGIQEFDRTSW